jgi:glycosyltransferase involved in cell wall biosynthesis
VRFLGPIGHERRSELLGGAHALLHLIDFEEPFGFSVVEGMACGSPVVAFSRGSMPELIDHGRTGFVVDDIDDAVRAVAAASSLDRPSIHRRTVERFGQDRMVTSYLAVYDQILGDRVNANACGNLAE